MNILVINGSPKGKYSITLQTIHYLERCFPNHHFQLLQAGQKIRAFEKDFSSAVGLLSAADALLFSYPVYTFLAPSQLHRFIELLKDSGLDLRDKYATQLTTSKHFYDVTAHRYIKDNVLDLGMRYVPGLSADMEDLLSEQGRAEATQFFERFLWAVENEVYEQVLQAGASAEIHQQAYVPQAAHPQADKMKASPSLSEKEVVIVSDCCDETSNLQAMIERFRSLMPCRTRVVNIAQYPLAGGCMGCFRCAVSEKCAYKDGFDVFLREQIQTADAMVYAAHISNHCMGARFKMYDDRNFCNGHRAVTVGTPVAYLLSGAYSREENLRMLIEARAETGGNFLAGVASDEHDTDAQIDRVAKSLLFALETKHRAPQNFWGVGGTKIFRDLIYQMRGMMRADHKFYKKRGLYDFPQKHFFSSLKMYPIGWLLSNEKIVAHLGNKMNEGMLAPYKKLFDAMDKKKDKN